MTDRRRPAALLLFAAVVAVPVTLALTDRHLSGATPALIVSTTAGAPAVSALALQPLLTAGRRIARHRALGVLRYRLPLHSSTWRGLHAYLAVVVLALGIGHAVLTDGALDDLGTAVLLALGAVGLIGVPAAHVVRTRLARR